jgi:hypothetical protein
MPVSRTAAVALFPTRGAIPEELQIGRASAIGDMTSAAEGGTTLIFAEDRRLGKSSMLLAMTDRILRDGEDPMALSVDLRDGITDSGVLAVTLLTQAAKQGAGAKVKAMTAKGLLKKALAPSAADGVRAAGVLLGEQDDAAAVSKLMDLLAPKGASLRGALLALDANGRAAGERTVIVLDEAQDLVRWSDSDQVQQELANAIKRPGSTVNFVFSGSEKSTLLALYEDAKAPLHGLGRRFALPEISHDAWYSGLRERFERCGITIERNQVQQIVYHSEGHPLRTMLICAHTLDWLFEDTVTVDTVERAIKDAERHPSWSLP